MRKIKYYTVESEGRDKGKVFELVEMPAKKSEKWALRLFLALAKSGVDIPEETTNSGLAGIAAFGLRALGSMTFTDAEPLLDEMYECIKFVPDPNTMDQLHNKPLSRPLIDDDTEEIATRLELRKAVFELHTNFSKPVAPLT